MSEDIQQASAVKLTKAQLDALDFCDEVCRRADALGISLAKFPVPEVRELIAAVRRAALGINRND